MPELFAMKPADLLRRLNRLATRRGWNIETAEGGGHTKVWFNGRRTTVPRHTADLKTGTFRAILKQLDVTEADLEV
jgi:predicted RNA binding protein YcfA (HicA-like mRNA interferase family)